MRQKISIKEQAAFFLPLAATSFLIVITHSLFNAGLARLPTPEILIAAFAVSKSFLLIMQSPLMMFRQTVVALIDHRSNYRKTKIFLAIMVCCVVLSFALIAFTGISRWVLHNIMGLNGKTLAEAVKMLQVLFVFPAIVALRDFYSGLSIKFRTVPLIALASLFRVIYVIIFVSFIDNMSMLPSSLLAGLMFVGGATFEALVMIIGTRLIKKSIPKALESLDHESTKPRPPQITYNHIFRFILPLIVTTLIKTTAMPFINGVLARTVNPDLALTVFEVSWGLGMIFLSPFMMFHQVSLNYISEINSINTRNVLKFAFLTATFSSSMLIIISFSNLGYYILNSIIGTTPEISLMSIDVLKLMSILPFLMVAREYYWGILMKRRITHYILRGKVISLLTIVAVVAMMIYIGPANPAITGVVALIGSEFAEFIYLFIVSKHNDLHPKSLVHAK